jgi:hypothetical protein
MASARYIVNFLGVNEHGSPFPLFTVVSKQLNWEWVLNEVVVGMGGRRPRMWV